MYKFTTVGQQYVDLTVIKNEFKTARSIVTVWEADNGNIYELNNRWYRGNELTYKKRAQLLIEDGMIKIIL